jgi:hypothetical protein
METRARLQGETPQGLKPISDLSRNAGLKARSSTKTFLS